MNYYPFHIGDFRSGTVNMNRQSRWIYRDMLDVYYDTETPLTLDLDALCDTLGVEADDERKIVERLLRFKFEKTDDGYRHSVCDQVISDYHAKAEQSRINGGKGGRPKKKNNPEKPSGFPSGSHQAPDSPPSGTYQKGNQEPITNIPTKGGIEELEVLMPVENTTHPPPDSFRMFSEWKPSDQFHTLARQAGLVTGNDKDFQAARVEFISYWLTQPRTRTQHEWDHAFLKSLKADKLHAGNNAGKPVRASDSNWRRSEQGIEAKGKEYGLSPRPGESWPDYARRIDVAIEEKIRGKLE